MCFYRRGGAGAGPEPHLVTICLLRGHRVFIVFFCSGPAGDRFFTVLFYPFAIVLSLLRVPGNLEKCSERVCCSSNNTQFSCKVGMLPRYNNNNTTTTTREANSMLLLTAFYSIFTYTWQTPPYDTWRRLQPAPTTHRLPLSLRLSYIKRK